MKLVWTIPLTALLIPLIAGVVLAAPQAYQAIGDCDDAQIDSIGADDDVMYIGRSDGYVQAVDRDNGRTLWSYPQEYTPDAAARSLVSDEDRVYVVYTNKGNGVEDPVIALDKDTGIEVWRSTASKNDLTRALDPFRITQDADHLYVGKDGGQIVKLDKDTGKVPKIDGVDAVFTPSNWDTNDQNAIWAIEAHGGSLWAARNWSNETDQEVLNRYSNNTIIALNTETMTGGEFELTSGGENTNWAVFAMDADDSGNIYLVGAGRGTNAEAERSRTAGFVGIAPQAIGNLAMSTVRTSVEGDLTMGEGSWNDSGGPVNPAVITHFLSIEGDADDLYIGTARHPDSGVGYAFKLAKADLSLGDWGTVRNFGFSYVRDVHVTDDAVLVATGCQSLQPGHPGGVAFEVPKALAPAAVMMSPSSGELTTGVSDIAFRAHLPSDEVRTLTATLDISANGGQCADGDSCYVPLALYTDDELGASFGANTIVRLRDIDFSRLPAGNDYVLRLTVTDDLGRSSQDFAEFSFIADYAPPTVSDLSPVPDSLLTDRRPILSATYRDDMSLVNVGGIELKINERAVGPIPASMFNENGLIVDLSDPDLGFFGLREGVNNIELSVPDRSGNVAVKQWQIVLDSKVANPVLSPRTDTFVREVRPLLSAQFFEAVAPEEIDGVIFEGTDVTDDVTIIPPQAGLGTRLVYRPTADLEPGRLYSITFNVKDEVGNEGGPYKSRFRVDATPPVVGNKLPLPGELLTDDRPSFRFTLQDAGSGLAANTLSVFIDGRDVTKDVEQSTSLYEYRSNAPYLSGTHSVSVTALDVAGNIVSDTWQFTIDLEAPKIVVEAELPADQTAVKAGDTIILRAQIDDASPLRGVRMSVRGLDAGQPATVAPSAVPGQPGLYELTMVVKEEATKRITVQVSADDLGGLVGVGTTEVLIDNNPPQTRIKELPSFVGASFDLQWENNPRDDNVGGSGIAYYRVERQVDNGAWQVRFPRLTDTSVTEELQDGSFSTLRYRVFAIDNAGNVQPIASNVVETIVRGDPFPEPDFPATLKSGDANIFRAEPASDLPLEDGTAFFTIRGADGESREFRLDGFGRLYTGAYDFEDVPAGDYLLRFHFRDAQGFEMNSQQYTVKIVDGQQADEALLSADDQESPGLPLIGVLAALGLAARRRWGA